MDPGEKEYHIRRACGEDARAIAVILKETGWFEAMKTASLDESEKLIKELLSRCLADDSHSVYVAVDQDEVAAGYLSVHWLPYMFLRGPEGYVSELFVLAAARGSGIGAALLDAARDEAAQRDCSRLSLMNSRQRESYHRKFYEKQGWEERPGMANFIFTLQK